MQTLRLHSLLVVGQEGFGLGGGVVGQRLWEIPIVH